MKITKKCPECNNDMVVRSNNDVFAHILFNRETGQEFLGCSQWPDCSHTEPLPESIRMIQLGASQLPGFEE